MRRFTPAWIWILLAVGCASDDSGTGVLEGVVRTAEGDAVADAWVAVAADELPWDPAEARSSAFGRTARAGSFRFTGLAAGSYDVSVVTRGQGAAIASGLTVGGEGSSGQLEIVLEDGVSLAGRVVDQAGRALASPRLRALRIDEQGLRLFEWTGDGNGRYEVRLPPGTYLAIAEKRDFRPGEEWVVADRARAVEFVLVEEATYHAEPPAELAAWLRGHAIPLRTADPGSGVEDLQRLRALIGDARVVALGEATHGTHEFFRLKHRLLEYLVTEMGFNVFAMEAGFPQSNRVNDFIRGGAGDTKTQLRALGYWTWNTGEVLDLLGWLRRYNASSPAGSRVAFHGFDANYGSAAPATENLLLYLDRVEPALEADLRAQLDGAGQGQQGAPAAEGSLPRDVLADLDRRFERDREVWIATAGAAAWSLARRNLHVLRQIDTLASGPPGASREQAMAENVEWILDHEGPAAKVVLWAHNSHVALDPGVRGVPSLGQRLRGRLGQRFVSVGFSFDRGAFLAAAGDGGIRRFELGPAPPASVDGALASAGLPLFAVDLRALPRESAAGRWLRSPHPARGIGAVYREGSPGLRSCAAAIAYDVLVFVDRTTAAESLVPVSEPDADGGGSEGRQPLWDAPVNLGLEQGVAGQVPEGWWITGWSQQGGYSAYLSEDGAFEGSRCAVIEGRDASRSNDAWFGSLMQRFDAEGFRGRRVRFRAAVRVAGRDPGGEARLWLRFDRGEGLGGVLWMDNMEDRPIRSPEWRFYEIEGDVPVETEWINVGLVLVGEGRALLDAGSFEVVGGSR